MFLRLFLWFLAANLLAGIVTIAIALPLWENLSNPYDSRRAGQQAIALVQAGDRPELRSWLQQQRADHQVLTALLRPDGTAAYRVPRALRHAARASTGSLERRLPGGRRIVGQELVGPGGNWRWLVMLPGYADRADRWVPAAIRVLSGLLVVLLFAWAASRWLLRPLQQLQAGSRQLAAGNLGARVPQALTARRDELGLLGRDFNDMASRLQQLLERQQQLLGDVSHELRSPLTRLRLALEMAREDADSPQLLRVEQESERLDALLQQVLDLSRLEQTTLQLEPLDFAELVADVVAEARIEADDRQLQLRYEHLSSPCNGQPQLLRSAVDNVLRNAIRHNPPGGEILLRLKHDASGFYRLEVIDQGAGVSAEQLPMMFDAFWRASSARERQSGGSGYGLGLAIAQRALLAHGGNITAENRMDRSGLKVLLQLPAAV